MLRDLLRTHVFERFPAVLGASMGMGSIVLGAWIEALVAGPRALDVPALALAFVGAAVLGAGAFTTLVRVARHHVVASALEPFVFAAAFSIVTLAATVVGSMAGLSLLAALLAALGLPAGAGAALLAGGSVASAAVAAGALAWGFASHGGATEVTRHRIAIADLPEPLAGLRIAHLTDLHIGNGMEGARLAAVVDRTNALGADLVALSGDLFDNDAEILDDGAQALARLRAPLGVYAVLGNHDGFVGADDVAAALSKHAPSIELLRGRCAAVPALGPLFVAGFDDPGHDWKPGDASPDLDALAALRPAHGPTVLLMHRPDAFPRAAELGFALVLSGHFHGGQVALPLAGGRWNAACLLTRYDRGAHRIGGATLYVSRGLGYAGPRLRFASAPEIAVHELVPATRG